MKQKRFAENIAAVLAMLALQLAIFWAGYTAALSYISAVGGCGRLGSLQYYCGGGVVPGTYMTIPIVLAFFVPPLAVKLLAPKMGRQFSWVRIAVLYIVTLPLTFVAYAAVALLSLHHHGV